MKQLKTINCVKCGKPAAAWCGTVVGKQKMALGNYITVKVIAGFCNAHIDAAINTDGGSFGNYSPELMGKCIPLFSK